MKEYTLEGSIIAAALIIAAAICSVTPTMDVDYCEGCTVIKGATVSASGDFEHGIAIHDYGDAPTITYLHPQWANPNHVVMRYGEVE